MLQVPGVTLAIAVALGEGRREDGRGPGRLSTDELLGWTERKKEKDSEPVRHKGHLEGLDIGRSDAEELILQARVAAGWLKPEDLLPPETDVEAGELEAEETVGEAGDSAAPAQA